MATIHVFRYAESMHEVDPEYRNTIDPDLSDLGRQQCADLSAKFPYMGKVTHLVSSPMRRAVNSCLLSFAPAVAQHKLVLLPEITCAGSRISSFGSDLPALWDEFGDRTDMNAVPGHCNRIGPHSRSAYDLDKILARAAAARDWLVDLALFSGVGEDRHIVVMTHGHTAHFVTDDFEGVEPRTGYSCDWGGKLNYRSYGIDRASRTMVETPESRARRGMPSTYTLDDATKDTIKEILSRQILERTPAVHELYARHGRGESKGGVTD